MVGDRVDNIARISPRRLDLALVEFWQRLFPSLGKFISAYRAKGRGTIGMRLFVARHHRGPVAFELCALLYRLPKMRECLFRYVKMFVLGPAEMLLGHSYGLLTRCVRMGFMSAL